MKPVCLIMGAGAGIGGTVGKKFASEGYHAVLCRRSDEVGLETLVSDIKAAGGEASGFLLNAVDEGAIEKRIRQVEKEIGPIEVVLFNLGAQIGNRSLEEVTYKQFELGWRMATFGLFRMAKELFPRMESVQVRLEEPILPSRVSFNDFGTLKRPMASVLESF